MKISSVLCAAMAFGLLSCSSGPPSPKPGSPGFFWAVARESYRTGDLVKTNNTLQELSRSENEFSGRAAVWHLVVAAGLSRGYSNLADAYEEGGRTNLTSPLRFRNESCALRSLAANAALEFTQAVHNLADNPAPNVPLAFDYPAGSPAEPEGLKRVASGVWLSDTDRDALQTAMLQRGVLFSVAEAAGTPDDPPKALPLFQKPPVQISRAAFLSRMASLLYEESNLFGPKRMDRPNRLMLMYSEALRTLRSIPPSDETSELAGEIQRALKKFEKSGA